MIILEYKCCNIQIVFLYNLHDYTVSIIYVKQLKDKLVQQFLFTNKSKTGLRGTVILF